LRFDVDVLGIETGLSADDIEDRGGDNLERTDVVNFSPGRSYFPPNFFRSRKLRNFGSDILSTGKSKSNLKYQKIQVINQIVNISRKMRFKKVKVNQTKLC